MSVHRLWSHETQFSAEPTSAAQARAFVSQHLLGHGMPHLVDDIELVVSELATNAVRHAKTPIIVTLEQVDQFVLLTVADGSLAAPVRQATDVLDTGGRGLSIVDLVSHDWGVIRGPGETKSVWASFAARVDVGQRQGRHG